MLTRETTDIAVIGAGVIGLTIALELIDQGREVVLVDPGQPGMGPATAMQAPSRLMPPAR